MNTLIQINDALVHLPVGAMAMLFAIILGYMLKSAEFFPNKFIPWVVVPATAILFSIIQLCADIAAAKTHPWLSLAMNILIGFVFGGIAWLFHAQLLRRFVDPKLFNDDGSTKFLTKPKDPNNP